MKESLHITIDRRERGPAHGFELGDMVFAGTSGTATTRGQLPDQAVMIYVSATLLLDGVRELLTGKRRAFEFIGVDSSFTTVFRRMRRNTIEVLHRQRALCEIAPGPLALAVFSAVEKLLSTPENRLSDDDAAASDLRRALHAFSAALRADGARQ